MLYTVNFGNKNSYDDWNLARTDKDISLPEPKTSIIELNGADGYVDLSEVLCNEIKFKNRELIFEFTMLDDYEIFNDKIREIANFLHGKKFKIILSDDPNYYYVGRCIIDNWSSDKRIGKIVIKCDCEPYKYALKETVITKNVNGSLVFDIVGKRKTVCPVITSTSDMTITFNNEEYSISDEETQILNIQIKEGVNRFTVTGTGTITFKYQEGEL